MLLLKVLKRLVILFDFFKYFISLISVMLFPIKGHYEAISLSATVKYSNSKDPFAIKFGSKLWDLNAFRPDPRDNTDFYNELQSKNGAIVTVLYEQVQYTNKLSNIPRFIIWENNSAVNYFVNVR